MAKVGRPRKKKGTIDFKGFKYEKILSLNRREKVLDVYPQLQRYPELDKKLYKNLRVSHEKTLRYVMLMYTDSPLRIMISELAHRKKEAALLAGFGINDDTGRFAKDIEEILNCENGLANKMIIRFLRISENKKFMLMCGFEEARAKQMLKLLDGTTDKDTTKVVIENIKTLTKDLEDLEKGLLSEDKSPDLLDLLYNEIDITNLGISPEEIAELETEGTTEQVLQTPYVHILDGTKRSHNKI